MPVYISLIKWTDQGRSKAGSLPDRVGEVDKRIASLGGKARFQSLQAARRIVDNFRYAAALGDLRGRPVTVKRLRTFGGPLPGIYTAGS